MKKYRILLAALMVLPMLWACTDVDLCNEGEHPHRGSVYYQYQNPKMLPDSMMVLANRVINLWKGTMKVKTTTGKGYYVANAPMEWNDAANAYEPVTGSVDNFRLPVGNYKFVTFYMADSVIDYSEVTRYLNDPEMPLTDLNVSYKKYKQNDLAFKKLLPDWTDYNRYSDFIHPEAKAFYYDTHTEDVQADKQTLLNFNPVELTQEVQISFTIKKDETKQKFTVDRVFADLSGIPQGFNIFNGSIDVSRTNKIMFPMDKVNDKEGNASVLIKGTIHVPGIVRSNRENLTMGPGIMQVLICCSADTTKTKNVERVSKSIPVLINLYNTLTDKQKKPRSIRYSDGKAYRTSKVLKLNIIADLVLDGANVVKNTDDAGGLDQWIPQDEHFIVVDI